ncbi:MAG TPA: glycosyltransferase family 39 protein [bacterium]|nr:glycosyltransferase family 39 protein [bacterium]
MKDIVGRVGVWAASAPAVWWISLLAVILRLAKSSGGFSDDEVFDVFVASHPVAVIPSLLRNDFHPPFYFLLLHEWIRVSHSEIWVRLLSMTFGIAAVPMTYFLADRLASRRVAVVSALLVAISPYHITVSDSGKMYALVTVLALAIAWALPEALDGHPKWWAAYALGALFLVYSHNLGAFVVLGTALWSLVVCVRGRRDLGWWLASHLLILMGYLPWMPTLLHQAAPGSFLRGGVPRPTEYRAWSAAWYYWTTPYLLLSEPLRVKLTLPLFALVIVGLARLRDYRPAILPLIALGAVPFVLAVVLGVMGFPVFLARALPSVSIALYICLAIGLLSLRRYLRGAATLVVGLLMFLSLTNYLRAPSEDWRAVAWYLHQHTARKDVIAVSSEYYAAALGYYWTPPPRVIVWPADLSAGKTPCGVWMVDKNGPAYDRSTYRVTLARLFGEPRIVYVGTVPVIYYLRSTAPPDARCRRGRS